MEAGVLLATVGTKESVQDPPSTIPIDKSQCRCAQLFLAFRLGHRRQRSGQGPWQVVWCSESQGCADGDGTTDATALVTRNLH